MRIATACALLASVSITAWAQPATMMGTAEARAEFDKAEASLRADDWDAAVVHYGKAVDLDPDFFAACEQYHFVCTAAKNYHNDALHKQLEARYLLAVKQHPDKPIYRFLLGLFYQYKNPDLAAQYFREAVNVDPSFAPGWNALAFTSAGQGNLAESREYDRKAVEAWPQSPRYGMLYVRSLQIGEFPAFRQAALNYARKFPDQAVSILAYVAGAAPTAQDARGVYELLRRDYLPSAAARLEPLFQMYLREDSERALELAGQLAKPALVAYAQAIGDANREIASGDGAAALAAINAINLAPQTDRRMLEITRAKARDAAGDTALAYTELMAYFAAMPNVETRATLLDLGQKLRKNASQVDREVFTKRSLTARPGVPFSATAFDGKPVSLASRKGKVFLLNFWYPMCGPCRAEFLSLQSVLEKYRDRGFEILAVNAHPPEDAWVQLLMKGWRLDFLTLHGNDEFLASYHVTAFPASFLYGADGRIYYAPGAVGSLEARRELEMHVEALLDQARNYLSAPFHKYSHTSHKHRSLTIATPIRAGRVER
jgi:thiol-disulfide isomerase/thioredoxin